MLKDSQSRSDFFKSVTAAEGGAWGVKVSSSVGLMHSSEISETSVSFVTGMSSTLF